VRELLRRSRTLPRKSETRAIVHTAAGAATPKVSVVIPAMNEERTIGRVIRSARQVHAETEVIVVVNGSTDRTERIAARMGARVLRFPQRLGHDVGRAIGAGAARGDVVLFVDGDFVVAASELRPLVQAVLNGDADVALNSYLGPVSRSSVHQVILAKHALNAALGRPELRGVSLTTVPHALSRRAIDTIGLENLTVPPKAHAIALAKGLNVVPVRFVHAGKKNRKRRRGRGEDPIGDLILGDHLEALHWILSERGARGGFDDLARARTRLRW
jgi:glycosyltransferase involved in cell wall biosynthesis